MLGFLLVGYRYMGVECEILRVAARLGPCCERRSRGILLPPEDIVSMYFLSEKPIIRVECITHVPSKAMRRV